MSTFEKFKLLKKIDFLEFNLGVKKLSISIEYPATFAYWPSCLLFFCFAWLEISWPGASVPASVATALLTYTLITFLGMFIFGRNKWLEFGECFSVVYKIFAHFSITEGSLKHGKKEWFLRLPGIGLCQEIHKQKEITLILFILLLLSTVTYDGFKETEFFYATLGNLELYITSLNVLKREENIPLLIDLAGLLFFPIIFASVYFFFIWLSAFMENRSEKTLDLAGKFIYSIVPIAIAYHLSHYISLIAIEGQSVFRLISDPFGFGWNLFNTGNYKTDISIVNAKFVWYFSVISIVVGHIVSVYIAHIESIRMYAQKPQYKQDSIISQIPMIFLMIGYTMLSLWIIAQPIVG